MDDEAETYKLWRIRKTVMQVRFLSHWKFVRFYLLLLVHLTLKSWLMIEDIL